VDDVSDMTAPPEIQLQRLRPQRNARRVLH